MKSEITTCHCNSQPLNVSLQPFARGEMLDRIESVLEILMVSRSGHAGYYERLETPSAWYSEPWVNFDLLASRPEAYPAFVDYNHPKWDSTDLDQDHSYSTYPAEMSQLTTCLHFGPVPARGSPGHRRPPINQ